MSKFLPTLLFVTILVVAFSTVGEAGIKDGLILYFSFDSADGKTVKDGSVGKHNGTLDKASIVKDSQIGDGALEIKDQNASMAVDSFKELEEYQDNTYAWWMQFTAGSNGAWSQIIAKKAPGSDRSPGIWQNPGGTGLHYRYNPGNKGFDRIGPGGEGKNFPLKKWFHIAAVKKGANLTMYIDGKKEGSVGVPAKHAQGKEKLYIGKTGFRAATFIIDDLAIYNRALSVDEVKEVMAGVIAVSPKGKLATTWANVKY